jgi:hypothetical protein
MKFSEIEEIDQAHKKVMREWRKQVEATTGPECHMSYARFKVLRAVVRGLTISVDIGEYADLDVSTTASSLTGLRDSLLLRREPLDHRQFQWAPTKMGLAVVERLEGVFKEVNDYAKTVAFGVSGPPRP